MSISDLGSSSFGTSNPLAGLTGNINANIDYSNLYQYLTPIIAVIVVAILGIWLVCVIAKAGKPTRTYLYRKYLSNLYIAGKVREYAANDGIDLGAEEANYIVWLRKQKMKWRNDLDDKILDSVNAKLDKHIEAIEDSKTEDYLDLTSKKAK